MNEKPQDEHEQQQDEKLKLWREERQELEKQQEQKRLSCRPDGRW